MNIVFPASILLLLALGACPPHSRPKPDPETGDTGVVDPCEPVPEVCDGFDNDCDGVVDDGLAIATWYRDADGDGYGDVGYAAKGCSMPEGFVA